MSNIILILIICSYHLILQTQATLGPGSSKKKIIKSEPEQKPIQKELSAEDLVLKNIKPKDILDQHSKRCVTCSEAKTFTGHVLAYVTPWNSKGYDIAKTYGQKFNYISPVWLQIKKVKHKTYELTGTHDIDKSWINDVITNSNSVASITPRILFEKWSMDDLHRLFNDETEMTALVNMLVKATKKYKFNGYVLEIYMQLNGYNKVNIYHLIMDLADGLHAENKKLFIVIPPPIQDEKRKSKGHVIFNNEDFRNLVNVVDGFSLMTYDYASHNSIIGPNAPLNWIRANVEYLTNVKEQRAKILLGLNFYGMKFNLKSMQQSEPILGRQLIEILQQEQVEINYDDESDEHVFFIKSKNILIYFPTIYSIKQRIQLAKELGTGLSIWEIGQGLDYFYDLI